MKTNIKIIATSLALAGTVSAWAGIGGLNVQSHLGQPFSGSIVVTGDEAEALKSNRSVVVSGSGIRGTVVPQGNGSVVVRLRSSSPIREPMINLSVSAGRQTRQYTAMIDPSNFSPEPAPRHVEKRESKRQAQKREQREQREQRAKETSSGVKSGQRDFIERNGTVAAHQQDNAVANDTMPVERRKTARQSVEREQSDNNDVQTTRRQTQRERTRQTEPVTTGAVRQVRQSGAKAAVATRRHQAKVGETLSSIAERYRPRNMSLASASRALAIANPSVFKRGHTIQRATTLYIPTNAQWQAYAQRAHNGATAVVPKRQVTRYNVDNNQVNNAVVVDTPPPVATPNNNPPVETVAQPQTPPPSQPNTPKAAPPQNNNANTNPTPAATAPKPLNQKGTQPENNGTQVAQNTAVGVSAPDANGNNAAVSAAQHPVQAASSARVMRASAASAALMPPVEQVNKNKPAATAPVLESEDEEESETDWALYGGVGGVLAAAGVAAYFLRKRRSEKVEDEADEVDDDGDDVKWEEEPKGKANRAKPAAVATVAAVDDEQDFDSDGDFEALPDDADDVFIANAAPTQPATAFGHFESAASLDKDIIAANAIATGDDWSWDKPIGETNDSVVAEHLAAIEESDWSLDDGTTEPIAADYSLDDEIVKADFSDFGLEDDVIQGSKPKAADDIDAMFANALANLDDLHQASENQSAQSVGAELDDIDAMFADSLADLGDKKADAFAAEDEIDRLESLASFDNELSALENSAKPKSAAAELDDIDAMFAGALANLSGEKSGAFESDDDELAAFERPKAKPVAADLDDIDAMFAGALASLSGAKEGAFSADDDDELSALESSVKPKSAAAELDDIDAMFADKLANNQVDDAQLLDEADQELAELNAFSSAPQPEDDLDNLFASKFSSPITQVDEADDDIDALFAEELDSLDTLNQTNQALEPSIATDFGNSFSEFADNDVVVDGPSVSTSPDDMDILFADELSHLESQMQSAPNNVQSEVGIGSDDINDVLFADDLANSLSELNELNELNALSGLHDKDLDNLGFEQFADLEATLPSNSSSNMDDLFVSALSDIDVPLSNEPVIKPIISEEDIENLNSLSELDNLASNEPSMDTLFDDALSDLDVLDQGNDLADAAGAMAFEKPVLIQAQSATLEEEMPSDDVSGLAFDLSDFDALQNTVSETVSDETGASEIDSLAFDLSGFDSLTDNVEETASALDDIDALAFSVPEVPDVPLETPELTTPAVDFDLPDLAQDDELDAFASSLGDLETAESFADFDLPDSEEGIGFVSGAVGVGDAHETQLDLAKMYIEIEDTDAARAMLTKLIADADGDILAQAKTLLAQIS